MDSLALKKLPGYRQRAEIPAITPIAQLKAKANGALSITTK
jgi:hypothetical protein